MTRGGWKAPSNIAPTGVSVITTEGENSADDNSTTNLPSVLAGMERHEALVFVSKLYDHARAGHSVWGDKLLLRKFLGAVVACIRQLDHMTGTGYNSHRGQSGRC